MAVPHSVQWNSDRWTAGRYSPTTLSFLNHNPSTHRLNENLHDGLQTRNRVHLHPVRLFQRDKAYIPPTACQFPRQIIAQTEIAPSRFAHEVQADRQTCGVERDKRHFLEAVRRVWWTDPKGATLLLECRNVDAPDEVVDVAEVEIDNILRLKRARQVTQARMIRGEPIRCGFPSRI